MREFFFSLTRDHAKHCFCQVSLPPQSSPLVSYLFSKRQSGAHVLSGMWKSAAMIRGTASVRHRVMATPRALTSCLPHLRIQKCRLSTEPEHDYFENDDLVASGILAPHGLSFKDKQHALFAIGETPRTSVLMELTDRVGVLHDVLRHYWKYDINITRIESRPHKMGPSGEAVFDFFLDL